MRIPILASAVKNVMDVRGAQIRLKASLMVQDEFTYHQRTKTWQRGNVALLDSIYRRMSVEEVENFLLNNSVDNGNTI